ncbi:MAG TPA: DUF1080 domain-containing protein [Tepidisphaeraceae bacterium]|nr:DUF1080 domain-containing protein [Tepidisphaeraceae bacterium]
MKRFSVRKSSALFGAAVLALAGVFAVAQEAHGPKQPWSKYFVHDMQRPAPPVVDPGTASTPDQPGKPPSDAIVLFDGKDMSHWQADGGGEPTFKLANGVMLSYGPKDLQSKDKFGDIQLHVEWAEPTPAKGSSQGRGNSGVFLMGLFEIQVLDNYKNPTYPDGQCSGIYGQYPPQVNVCRPPGEWQTYDIIFHTPRKGRATAASEAKLRPAYVTVLQNGVLTQDHQRIEGPSGHMIVAKYPENVGNTGPIKLQFHGNPVRYRNIWVRPLAQLQKQQHTGEVAQATEKGTEGQEK